MELATAAHFPEWVRAMDGMAVPLWALAGYQVTRPSYETWRHVLCLSWSHFNRRINLSDKWADVPVSGREIPVDKYS